MLILKLKLPEAKVTYNQVGICTSVPVPYTPEKIKNTRLSLEITGYLADDGFFAFRVTCPEKPLVLSEQLTLLSQLGFRTVPTANTPDVAGALDDIIRTRLRYAKYGAEWYDYATGEPYKVPELATIEDSAWVVDNVGRVCRRLFTDKGEYDIIDHRLPEFYQVGSQVKIWNGKVQPYMSAPIMDPVITHCPKCNNPLKRMQISVDLPVILKCVNPVCKLMKMEDPVPTRPEWVIVKPKLEITPEMMEQAKLDAHLKALTRPESVVDAAEQAVVTTPVEEPSTVVEELDTTNFWHTNEEERPGYINIENVEVPSGVSINEYRDWDEVHAFDEAQCAELGIKGVLRKSKRSVTKASKQLAEKLHLPLINPEDLVKEAN